MMSINKTVTFFSSIVALAMIISSCSGFTITAAPTAQVSTTSSSTTSLQAYIPSGLTAEQYRKIQEQDKKNSSFGKNLGALGPRGFKSRSMQAWQEAYERGEAGHSMAPYGYREKLKSGQIKKQDVPYMVRGGSWDNADVRGAKKKRWLKSDVDYSRGGYKKEQSASILGSGPGFDWTGTRSREENLRNRVIPGLS